MPDDKEYLKAILDGFIEVAFRANRLREWTVFDVRLYNLDIRFTEFHNEVRTANDQGNNANMPKIADIWERCSTIEIIDLQTFISGVNYINKTTWQEPGNGAAAQPVGAALRTVDLSSLDQPLQKIDQELMNGRSTKRLLEYSVLFRKALNAQKSLRQQTISDEIKDLCELTIRLRASVQNR